MIPAKEKAVEMVNKFHHSAFGDTWTIYLKRCAIITVDEILYALSENKNDPKFKYWNEVKEEIEKI